jgi:hypothetical protein
MHRFDTSRDVPISGDENDRQPVAAICDILPLSSHPRVLSAVDIQIVVAVVPAEDYSDIPTSAGTRFAIFPKTGGGHPSSRG